MMTEEMAKKLKRSITLHEGWREFPYIDTQGNITIGYGYDIKARGLSNEWASNQRDKDSQYFYENLLHAFPWFKDLNSDRQIALIDMCYNVGFKNFCEFHNMLAALTLHNYEWAASEMLESDWARQVKSRAETLANVIRNGVYNL